MELLKILSKHTKEQVEAIISTYTEKERKRINKLYLLLRYCSFIDHSNYVGMYCIKDKYFDELYDLLLLDLEIEIINVSKNFLRNVPLNLYKPYYEDDETIEKELSLVTDYFYEYSITNNVDIILEKITSKGMDSLTEVELTVLHKKSLE